MEVSGQLHTPSVYPRYPLDRRLVDPRAGLDEVVRRKIPSPSAQRYTTELIWLLFSLRICLNYISL